MAPLTARKHPNLIVTVLAGVLARNRELTDQVASLSAENARIQDDAAAHDRELSGQIASLWAGKVQMQDAMAEQDLQLQALEQKNEMLTSEKDQREFANLDQELADSRHKLKAEESADHHAFVSSASRRKSHTKSAVKLSQKRGHEPDNPAKRIKKVKHTPGTVCIECYHSKTTKHCDGASTCWPCQFRDKDCKRMKCKNFAAGTCRLVNCSLAHSDSGFPKEILEEHHHVPQSLEPPPFIPPKP
ncbi:uncharacterized protein J4E79_008856 [Alternaria viburni]|uniref:uncharacterized protein n=1 Tax=Alternaria viburni TaxID=566460 RepID=UPI0020C1C5DE|nr:uncharacterized protein J4E79_008856 [Alternaria viburni]KAI4652550.1 hypothetical protein J4E79_008856 [Alternaria viburni]